jgi:DNA-binding IclR family transcriptional regulator
VNSIAIPVLAQDRSLIAAILMIGNESDMDVACGADLDANVSEILASLGPEELT